MKRHPTDEALLQYSEAAARDGDPSTRDHLAEPCRSCLEKVALYREVLRSLHAPPLRPAPREWVQEALCRIEQRASRPQPATGTRGAIASSLTRMRDTVREVQFGLVLDSWLGAALPGIRSSGTLAPRQLLFESEAGSLHLQLLEAQRGKTDLIGQFVPVGTLAPRQKIRVVLRRGGSETQRLLPAAGAFRFAAIPAGEIEIGVLLGDAVLATGPIQLRPEPDV